MRHALKEKRSPLKEKPLRNPGESVQEELDSLLQEELMPVIVGAFFTAIFAVIEWYYWYFRVPRHPMVMTIVALLVIGYAVRKYNVVARQARNLKLGLEGEKAVGQYLEQLRSRGCRVIHDVIGDKFNIDHVVVSPRGIFVIETKTYSKPAQGRVVADFDGERLLINGYEPDRNPVHQARALGDWLRDLLAQSTSRTFPVRSVVVLPGWFVEAHNKQKGDVWVLNPKALPAFIANEPIVFDEEDVALITSRLMTHVRAAG